MTHATVEQKRIAKVRARLRRKGYTLRENAVLRVIEPCGGNLSPWGTMMTEDGDPVALFSILKDGMPVEGLTTDNMPRHSINLTLEEVDMCVTWAGTSRVRPL